MHHVSEAMKHVPTLAKRDPGTRVDHLWDTRTNPAWRRQAWEEIRSQTGRRTAGIDHMIAVDIDPERIQRLSARLNAGRYQPQPVRRVAIAKGNGERRPLGIPTREDRIVPQALRRLMEPIFEADLYPCSHGFRRHRSTPTALRDVARRSPRTTWTMAADSAWAASTPVRMGGSGKRSKPGWPMKQSWRSDGSSWPQETWSSGSTTRRTVGRHRQGCEAHSCVIAAGINSRRI